MEYKQNAADKFCNDFMQTRYIPSVKIVNQFEYLCIITKANLITVPQIHKAWHLLSTMSNNCYDK